MIHIPEWRHVRRRGSILCAITQHGWKEISSMKRTTKKTLFVFVLIAAMMLSIFPAAAFAEGAAAGEPAAQTEQQPEKDAAPAAKDDGENKAEPVKNDEKPVVVEGKDGEKPADPELKDGEEKGEPEVKNDGEEPVKEEGKAEDEKNAPVVSKADAFVAAVAALQMPEDVMALTDEECKALAAQINDLFVMYSQLSEEDLALPEVQAAAAALNAAYTALDARNTAEVLLPATQASSIPLNLTVTSYGAPFKNGTTGAHDVNFIKQTKYINKSDACVNGESNTPGKATAHFEGSNETGWNLVIVVEAGNYKATWTTNAWIYNKDMSGATGEITFGLSWNTSGGVSTTIRITGGKDLPATNVDAILNYDANGGTGAPASQSKSGPKGSSATFTVSSTTPTRDGYTFKGWNTDPSGNGTAYEAGKTISVAYGSTTTLYAQWEKTPGPSPDPGGDDDKKETKLEFKPNAGDDTVDNMPSDMTDTPKAGETSVAFPIPTTIPTREGYEFKHWNTKDDDSGDTYERGATINVPVGTTGTLYAIWGDKNPETDKVYAHLEYDGNGDTTAPVTGVPASVTSDVAGDVGTKHEFTVSDAVPVREGYTFMGWTVDKNGTGTVYQRNDKIEVAYGSTTTLYAQWEMNLETKLVYDANANDATNVDPSEYVQKVPRGENAKFTVISDEPTRPGYTFTGWSDTADGDVAYKSGATVEVEPGDRKVLYAQWKFNEVTPVDWGKLGISKSVSPTGPVKPGTTLTYTITVTNNTGADLDSVLVCDVLSNYLTFVSATGAGTYDKLSGFWKVGALANGDSATLVIKATVNAGVADKTVIYNTAYVFNASVGSENIPSASRPSASANVAVTNPGSSGTWGKGVQTGDDANLGLWIAAMIVSFLCVAALVYVNRKRIFKGKANNK